MDCASKLHHMASATYAYSKRYVRLLKCYVRLLERYVRLLKR